MFGSAAGKTVSDGGGIIRGALHCENRDFRWRGETTSYDCCGWKPPGIGRYPCSVSFVGFLTVYAGPCLYEEKNASGAAASLAGASAQRLTGAEFLQLEFCQ